jgi:hypothetical protein
VAPPSLFEYERSATVTRSARHERLKFCTIRSARPRIRPELPQSADSSKIVRVALFLARHGNDNYSSTRVPAFPQFLQEPLQNSEQNEAYNEAYKARKT